MNRCQCKSGFFALRDCEWNAITQCAVCRRMVCAPHMAPDSVPQQCRDCWARRAQEPRDDQRQLDQPTRYDDDWADSYRRRYYDDGYSPMVHSSRHHGYYDDHDARSFAAEAREPDDDADDPQAGFGDS